jgi:hypothetical protein
MSDCACIYDGDNDGPSVSMTRMRKARKVNRCTECREAIRPGETYEHTTGCWDGRWSSFKTCLPCVEIRGALFCEGWTYSAVWGRIAEHLSDGGSVFGCVRELASVAAREKLTAFARDQMDLPSEDTR